MTTVKEWDALMDLVKVVDDSDLGDMGGLASWFTKASKALGAATAIEMFVHACEFTSKEEPDDQSQQQRPRL